MSIRSFAIYAKEVWNQLLFTDAEAKYGLCRFCPLQPWDVADVLPCKLLALCETILAVAFGIIIKRTDFLFAVCAV